MPIVTVTVRNNQYPIACESGQEDMLHDIAKKLDERINILAKALGKGSDLRLLVLTALMMESEIQELKTLPDGSVPSEQNPVNIEAEIDKAVAQTMEAIAERIEKIALHVERV